MRHGMMALVVGVMMGMLLPVRQSWGYAHPGLGRSPMGGAAATAGPKARSAGCAAFDPVGSRARMLHPHLGRFIQRDPVGYVDGMNLYQCAQSDILNAVDPNGLWRVTRNGGARASAVSEADDTIASLAAAIGLDSREFYEWLVVLRDPIALSGGGLIPAHGLVDTDRLCPDQEFEIPNTVLYFWTGDLGGFGRGLVKWRIQKEYLQERGFLVVEQINEKKNTWTGAQLAAYLKSATSDQSLHGLYLWSHGWRGGIANRAGTFEVEYAKLAPPNALAYHLGLVIINACDSGWDAASNGGLIGGHDLVAKNGLFGGFKGTLVPKFDDTDVRDVLKPGDQRTRGEGP